MTGHVTSRHWRYAKLIEPHRRALLTHARTLTRNEADAQDLVQNTLLRAYEKLDTLNEGCSAKPWLFTIQKHLFLNARVRNARLPDGTLRVLPFGATAEEHLAAAPWEQTERVALLRLTAAAVQQAVWSDVLPAAYREALLLCCGDGAREAAAGSYEEAAARLGVPLGTVRSRVHRARSRVLTRAGAWL